MKPARHRPADAVADLARVLVVYLCLILALQGFAAARALGSGPLHRHAETALPAEVAGLAFSHHGHQHATDQRHHHARSDPSVLHAAGADAPALDATAFALTAALALLATGSSMSSAVVPLGQVQRAAPAWTGRSVAARLPYRPPRAS